jgi:predicted ArsR family transcriptional regulator
MKLIKTVLVASAALALAACGTQGDDKSAEMVREAAENAADEIDAEADNASGAEEERLEDTADVIRDTGEAAAESVDDHDLVLNEAKAR